MKSSSIMKSLRNVTRAAIAGFVTLAIASCGGGGGSAGVNLGTSGEGGSTRLFTTAQSSITIAPGAAPTYTIGGGKAPYTATSNNEGVATVMVSGAALTITGVTVGSASVSVFDSTGASVSIAVTVATPVSKPMTLLPNGATGNSGDTLTFIVSGGTPGYTITVNNPSIATVSPTTVSASGGTFTATLLNAGTTTATIVDALGQTTSISLTAALGTSSLRLSPSALVVGEDYTGLITLNIYGGTAPYRALTSDLVLSSVPDVTFATALSVGLGSQGSRCIASGTKDITLTVIDSTGASATSVLTIKDNGLGGALCN